MTIQENVPLAPFTTFRLGGRARFFFRVKNLIELKESLAYASDQHLSTLILGGGSNVLIGDAGFDGLVIKIELIGVECEGTTIIAAAGESWDDLVERSIKKDYWGLENLSGIPGTVGAAPIQNIGAYGAEVKDTLVWVEAYDRQVEKVVQLQNAECEFSYRTSRFKKEPGRFIILRAAFTLKQDGTPNSSYKDLSNIGRLNLPDIRAKVLAVRATKFPDLAVEGTAGSFFLNPVVSTAKAAALLEQYPNMPQFKTGAGVKVSLAWLLDNALNLKGLSVGGARLFERQPLVIAASRDAHTADIVVLKEKVKNLAKEKLGLEIEEEVRII